ncbi:unnamed protein product, partial [Durusdinium trenchii]
NILHVQEPSCRRGHVDPMRSVRRLRDLRRWAMFQRGCALAPSRAQRSRVVRCRRFLRHPVALGELLASLPLQPYTHEADDLGEDGEAVHCTKYVQTDGLFARRFATLRKRILRLAARVARQEG